MKAISASIIVFTGAMIFNKNGSELFGVIVGFIGFVAWVYETIPTSKSD
jgi:hypothetical protein